MNKNIAVIILAAGKGERMKSNIPKVLHPICGRPMLAYVLDLVKGLKIKKVVCVLGHKQKEVKKFIPKGIDIVSQKEPLGTGDAVRVGLSVLKKFKGAVLILYADSPLFKKETVKKLLEYHFKNSLDATLLTAHLEKPLGYGRILRDKYSSICGIAEEREADDYEKDIKEINTGPICFNKAQLAAVLREIRPSKRKKEYYLTDAVAITYKRGYLVDGIRLLDLNEALGINSRQDLAQANRIMQRRINEELMKEGVSIVDSDSTFINYGARIGRDTIIYPFTVIESDVKIGKHCFIGPFAHLREGTELKDKVVAGNFLEIARSKLGIKTLAKHFCYIGDSHIGQGVNIGAGTVTANFDGRRKNTTVIKDKALIGSDTVLVAPVEIGRGAITGAGSVVLKNRDVADRTMVAGVPARPLRKIYTKK